MGSFTCINNVSLNCCLCPLCPPSLRAVCQDNGNWGIEHITDISRSYIHASEEKLHNIRNKDILDLQCIKGALYLIYMVILHCAYILRVSVRDKLFFQIYQTQTCAKSVQKLT